MIIKAKMLHIDTDRKVQLLDLTEDVTQFVSQIGIRNGMGMLSTLHTTTGVLVTETQDALWDDVDAAILFVGEIRDMDATVILDH